MSSAPVARPKRAPASTDTTYVGRRIMQGEKGVGVVVVAKRGEVEEALDPRFDLANRSPSGFEWGFAGSGPAQLALAIVADVLGDDALALSTYEHFKHACVAKLETMAFELTAQEARAILRFVAAYHAGGR